MADRFIALYYFDSMFVHGVVKLTFSKLFFSDWWLKTGLEKHDNPRTADAKANFKNSRTLIG